MTISDTLQTLDVLTDIYDAPLTADVRALAAEIVTRETVGVYVARDERHASLAEQWASFFEPKLEVVQLPAWDTLPYDRISPSPTQTARRCSALSRLARLAGAPMPVLVITTATSMVQRIPPRASLVKDSFLLEAGHRLDEAAFIDYLGRNGYSRTDTAREKGEFAVRGGIIDVFPPAYSDPIRIDLFGDTIEELKAFDAETQRSIESRPRIEFAPASEIEFSDETLALFRTKYLEAFGSPAGDQMYEAARAKIRRQGLENWLPLFHDRLETLFDLLPEDSLLGVSPLAKEAARERLNQVADYFDARVEAAGDAQTARVLSPDALYLNPDEFDEGLERLGAWIFHTDRGPAGSVSLKGAAARDFAPERVQPEKHVFEEVVKYANDVRSAGKPICFAAWTEGSAERLRNVLEDNDIGDLKTVYSKEAALNAGISVATLPLEQGVEFHDLLLLSEADILGDRLAAPRRKRKAANFISEAASLQAGDLVVHVDHGVAKYIGLKTLEVTGAAHDCLTLEYAAGDKIFLPVENIDLISRYGSEDAEAAIDRLGGAGWQTRKAKAKKRILEMAAELMQIAAARQLKKADPINSGEALYEEFAARFPYEETDDQLNAIADCLTDLASGRPMDRLVCGDVGFGKTEVALRAAFVAAMSGMQVAIIAPTTLLARQHFKTFESRFSGWPIEVRPLSRLVAAADASATRQGLKDSTVDVVVGTHALLSDKVAFKHLGLVIVDEEQRFGVKHKERLKEFKADVHVLTLSATPIPRTLQMALTGIRDLSIIATPPVDRLSVRTYVSEFDAVTIREALLRERYRGGQAFFVAPRISDLGKLEDFLKDNVPEVSYVVAHGQMPPSELEDIMTAFYDGEYDVLLSTTIVESGLDIPRANTLVIYRADMFGLAQLYQLRGRVGRSKLRAYAYFLSPDSHAMTSNAERRLKVLQQLDSLGAGFQLASHDLDMRGGGNLLGDAQSGHIREVGVELYQQMLEEAVNALQAGGTEDEFVEEWSPQINLGVSVLIPESYVNDLTERLSLYRRLASIDDAEGREGFAVELIDRFGPLPDETNQLLQVTDVKALCKSIGIAKVDAGPKGVIFAFREDTALNPVDLMKLVQRRPNQLKLRPDSKLVYTTLDKDPVRRMKLVQTLLKELNELATAG